MAGKGDKWRKTDYKNYYKNWENIKPKKEVRAKEIIKSKNKTTYKY